MDAKSALIWAKRNSAPPEDRAKARIHTLTPGANSGTVKVPFPVVDREEFKKSAVKGKSIAARTHKASVEDVPLSDLQTIQHTVNVERLQEHLDDPHLIPTGTRASGHGGLVDRPVVIRKDGKMTIWDGNHRATAAHLRGQPTMRARVVDLDQEPQDG